MRICRPCWRAFWGSDCPAHAPLQCLSPVSASWPLCRVQTPHALPEKEHKLHQGTAVEDGVFARLQVHQSSMPPVTSQTPTLYREFCSWQASAAAHAPKPLLNPATSS